MHLRTKHSKLIGYWISEIGGGIHEVIHIWEYGEFNLFIHEFLKWTLPSLNLVKPLFQIGVSVKN